MGRIRGQMEYQKFLEKKPLTRKQAMLANCYVCNGLEESAEDCLGNSCPLYQYQPYKGRKSAEKGTFIHA